MFLPAPYGRAHTIRFPIVKRAVVDFAVAADWTPVQADCKLSLDGANVGNATNTIAAVGGAGSALWSLALTAGELTANEVAVQIVDSATKAVEDQALIIRTLAPAVYDALYGRTANLVVAPQVAEVLTQAFDSDTTSHAVTLPAAVHPGDLLLIIFASDGNPTFTPPTGFDHNITATSNGTAVTLGVFEKLAVGTEGGGGGTADVVTSASEQGVAITLRIKAGTFHPDLTSNLGTDFGTAATGTDTAPNPPNVTIPWGAQNSLVLALYAADDQAQATAYPTGYDSGQTIQGANAAGASLGLARKILAVNSENPGTFTCASQEWVASTIVIRPAQVGDVSMWRGSRPNALISGRADVDVQAIAAALIASSHFANMPTLAQGAPPDATDPITAQAWLYAFAHLKQTIDRDTSVVSLYAPDGTTVLCKATVTDVAGLFTRPRFLTGA